MLALLGTRGDTQVTSKLSVPTWPKAKSVGAGTAVERERCLYSTIKKYMKTLCHLLKGKSLWLMCVCDPCLKFYDILKVREQAACASEGKMRLSMIKTPQLKPDGPRVHALTEDY